MRIIPAIDIIGGKCVRLTQGDYATQKVYSDNPLDIALMFEENGLKHLHLVDLDGAKAGHVVNYKLLNNITSKTTLSVDFGGGLRTTADVQIAFDNGARQITGGSIAIQNPEEFCGWIARYGSNKILLGADCLNRKVAVNAWKKGSNMDIIEFISAYKTKGITRVICTDITKDGMLQGASEELYNEIIRSTQVQLIASGGVSSLADLLRLKALGCEGAIIGKAIYENKITLKELSSLC